MIRVKNEKKCKSLIFPIDLQSQYAYVVEVNQLMGA